MPASKRRDRFRPPASDERRLELARGPSVSSTEPSPVGDLPAPPRQPLRYQRPRASWLTVVVLIFAAVGATPPARRLGGRIAALASAPATIARPRQGNKAYHPPPQDDTGRADLART